MAVADIDLNTRKLSVSEAYTSINIYGNSLVFIAAGTTINRVNAGIDIENVLRTLQQLHNQQKQHQSNPLVSVKEKNDRKYVTEDESRFGSLAAKEMENLIQRALTDDNTVPIKKASLPYFKNRQLKKQKNNFDLYSVLQATDNQNDDDDTDDGYNEKVYILQEPERKKKYKETQSSRYYIDQIKKLFSDSGVRQKYVSKKKRLQPNDLLGDTVYSEAVNRDNPSGLNDHSKVYVILNVDAIQQSSTRDRLTNLVYSMLQSAPYRQRERKQDQRYKGFLVNDDFKRGGKGRHSVEAMDMSDFMPKRLRSHEGSAGGRAPTPYI